MIERAVFTPIAGGRLPDGERLKVTVFVTPKLAVADPPPPGATLELGAFDGFANWPKTLADARWAIDVDGVGAMEARPLDDPIAPDPDLWDRLFGATAVGDASFQHFENSVVHSYPVEEVAKAVTGLYQSIAAVSATEFPAITRGPLAGLVKTLTLDIAGREDRLGSRAAVKQLLRSLRKKADGDTARFLDIDEVPVDLRAAVSLAAATAFYDRTDDPWDHATATAPAPAPVAPEFHSFAARCADFPELLRHLGLAVDLWIPDDGSILERTTLRVLDGANAGPLEALLAPEDARPRALTHHTERFWAPASRTEQPDVVDGSLVVDETRRFLVEQIDPDGSALKVVSLLGTLQRTDRDLRESGERNNFAPSMTPDASSLPALRSAGILIARRNRAQDLVRQLDRSADHEQDRIAGEPTDLDAADVTRGWRIDIQDRDAGGEWLSLHRRVGQYELVAPMTPAEALPVQPKPDEAYLKAATTSSTDAAPTADQYLHETIAGWDGWSLAAKRPGKVVDQVQPVDPTVDPATDGERVADSGFPLAARFTPVPGSLPRLRFGRSYRLRVRAVDLSGESIPSEQLDETHERDLDGSYQRWEPVPSPAVVPLTEYTEGESLMRMVIRSTLDVAVADYVALPRVRDLTGHEASGDLGIVYREANERHLAAPAGSVQLAETHGEFDRAFSSDPAKVAEQFAVAARESGSFLTLPGARAIGATGTPTPLDGTKGQELAQGEYIVHNTRELALPYLPDPLARGVSFTTLPGDSATRLLRWPGESGVWFDRQPVLVRIVEGTAEPEFDADAKTLTVFLPKAAATTVRLSSFLDDEGTRRDPDLMRVWNLMATFASSPATAVQRDLVRRGLHWMITPFSELTLVHAVEKPLEPPAIVLGSAPNRTSGATFSLLPGVVHNHAASTGRIDIDAAWEDPVDDVRAAQPGSVAKTAHVADFSLTPSEVDAQLWPTNGPAAGPFGPRHEARHEFGDTRHRYVDYMPMATTRFREYFPPAITERPELVTSTGAALRVNVLSSARPDAPVVKYIVPTWEWQQSVLEVAGSPLAVRRVRTGGGLRVYLARPWFSSGPDELLGVVLARQPWLTWPVDVDRGVLGSVDDRALADGWAQRALEASGIALTQGRPASTRLAQHILDVAADVAREPRAARPRARTDTEKFLVAADSAVEAARLSDTDLVRTNQLTATTGLLDDFLGIFGSTDADGRCFCSVWGADPVFDGAPLPSGPFTHQFPLRSAVGSSVSLAEVPGQSATVVGHQPQFDADRRLWFCDIQIDAGAAYTPLVQLRLARYQPHSVAGAHISPTVKTDFAQLLPRREASYVLAPDSGAMAVTLRGPVGVPAHAIAMSNVASEVRASRVVEALIERLPAGATSDLDWERVGDPVALPVRLGLGAVKRGNYSDVEWAGAVAVPAREPGDALRVRIAEYELHEADLSGILGVALVVTPRARRLVYADELLLP
ncbi:hypothetical protein [Conyzicola sp.]|uniref:hypothetical protein n=1 Tax=Conyzicola sp. TaxID=1969404 RepID=UPI00398A1333